MSYDFSCKKRLSLPTTEADSHGTKCAGQIVSSPNSPCGQGIAFGSRITGIKILSSYVSNEMEREAINHENDAVDIYSCSWGPPDNGQVVDGPSRNVLSAFVNGVLRGRGGKGNIYVFACGNGSADDNCSFDGYTNMVFTVTIGAIDCQNCTFPYQKECPALLCVTYSSGLADETCSNSDESDSCPIYTTNISGECTTKHGGTSAAAPFATGIFALALSIRPDLTWRDIQYLCVESAIPLADSDVDQNAEGTLVINGSKKVYSTFWGFGRLSAKRLVEKAKTWALVSKGGVLVENVDVQKKSSFIDDATLMSYAEISDATAEEEIASIEHVTVTLSTEADVRGEMEIYLESPSGTKIRMASRRPKDLSSAGLQNWTMMTVGFWGETKVNGKWVLTVKSTFKTAPVTLVLWRLSVWGTLKKYSQEYPTHEKYMRAYE